MIKYLLFAGLLASASSRPFDPTTSRLSPFGIMRYETRHGLPYRSFLSHACIRSFPIRGGSSSNKSSLTATTTSAEDYERAEKTIFNSLAAAEKALEHAIHEEVDALFHDEKDHHKAKASEAIQKSAAQVRERSKIASVFDRKHPKIPDHPDSSLLYAIESSEQAMIDAVRKEMDLLFHSNHPKKEHLEKALENTQARKDKHDEKRQQYLLSSYQDMIENYESYVWE